METRPTTGRDAAGQTAPRMVSGGSDQAPSCGSAHPSLMHARLLRGRHETCPRVFYAFCVFPRPLSVTDTVGLRVWSWGQGQPGQEQRRTGTHLPALRFQGTRLPGAGRRERHGHRLSAWRFPAHRAPQDHPPCALPAEPLGDPAWEPCPSRGVASKPQMHWAPSWSPRPPLRTTFMGRRGQLGSSTVQSPSRSCHTWRARHPGQGPLGGPPHQAPAQGATGSTLPGPEHGAGWKQAACPH